MPTDQPGHGGWTTAACGGPAITAYNRFNGRSRCGFWRAMLAALAEAS